jgi:hypothetical protein
MRALASMHCLTAVRITSLLAGMDTALTATQNPRKFISLWLFFFVIFSCIPFFNNGYNVNAASRMALTLAIIEESKVNIDSYRATTSDISKYGNHYYSDKAPGMSFMALPVVAISLPALKSIGALPPGEPTTRFRWLVYIAAIFTSALPLACATVMLFRTALLIGANQQGALFASLLFALGTPAWGWATTFFSHAASASFQFMALALIISAEKNPTVRKAIIIGLLMGWSVVIEFTALPSIAMIGLYALTRLPAKDAIRLGIIALSAALTAIAPLLIYQWIAFDNPLSTGYQHVVGFAGMSQGLIGINIPRLEIIYELLAGEYRGLLWICPIIILSPLALFYLFRTNKALTILIAAIAIYYLLLNSGYYYWQGGWSTGPRHITPILPFLSLPFALLWTRAIRMHTLLAILLAINIALSLLCVSVSMEADYTPNYMVGYLLPRFLDGIFGGSIFFQLRLLQDYSAFLPLFAIWGIMAVWWKIMGGFTKAAHHPTN